MPPCKHYVLRHAHRLSFQPGSWGTEIEITKKGKDAAYDLGCLMSRFSLNCIWTSPLKRCVQTAEEVTKGYGIKLPVSLSPLLGDPGFMIVDPKHAEKVFEKRTLIEIINALLEGDTLPGFYPVDVGCKRMIRELLMRRTTTDIWISHDINITLLGCWFFRKKCSEEMIPQFLEGMEFSFDGDVVNVYFKGLSAKMDETSLRAVEDS